MEAEKDLLEFAPEPDKDVVVHAEGAIKLASLSASKASILNVDMIGLPDSHAFPSSITRDPRDIHQKWVQRKRAI